MKNITKILFVALTSLSLMFSANAGELTVNGTAKATYNASSGTQNDNGIGITNELNFTASGELDNGYTWSYSMELDPSTGSAAGGETAGAAINDDTQISINMNEMGTVKLCVSECGNNKKYAADQSAYTSASDTGLSEGIVYPGDEGSYATMQYHTPALPFGSSATIAHGNQKVDGQSGNAQGPSSSGDSATFLSVVTKPIDGLTISASAYEVNNHGDGTNYDQDENGGAVAAVFAYGNISAGIGRTKSAPRLAAIDTNAVEYYETSLHSVAYAVNDDLSVSYTSETGERSYMTSATTTYDIEMDSVQVAYSIGGATLSIARTDYENIGFANGVDAVDTIIAMTFAF
jgi:outer membrane protein OmpU